MTPPYTGSCPCKTLTYTLLTTPLITHCCHCTYCQSETGSAFALNSVIESYNLRVTSASQPLYAHRPSPSSPSGSAHIVAHCPNRECNADVWSHYGGNKATVYVKVGTLGEEGRRACRPDVHIFVESKVGWVDLEGEKKRGVKVFERFYEHADVWSEASLERLARLRVWKAEQEEAGVVL